VLRGAHRVLAADGLDGLVPSRVNGSGQHFPTRRALLEAVADDLLAGVDEPPAGPWDQRLRTVAHRLRQALLGVRDGARLVAAAGPAAGRALIATGLPPEQDAWANAAVVHYVLGHTIDEQASGSDSGRRFEFGLTLIIDGIRVRVGPRTPADS
jgi:hypothetical protein